MTPAAKLPPALLTLVAIDRRRYWHQGSIHRDTAISVDLRKDVTAGVVDSGGKFGRYRTNYTSGQFADDVIDTDGAIWIATIFANFRANNPK